MRKGRQPRKENEVLKLGNTSYQISKIEGVGGSTIVYRAFYEDKLNQGSRHQVLIKELFPYHQKGNIYRDEAGNIVCEEDGTELLTQCKESFYQGNQANLELLLKEPEHISGNINSYEAYGTFYSVLSFHGGENLQELLKKRQYYALPEAADVIFKILDALDIFHKNELLHLDISPNNVIMLSKQAMLIDYNSVWSFQRKADRIYDFSKKEGYTAPEVIFLEERNICQATDLYSVCAIFFRLLTGRCLKREDYNGKGVVKCFPKSLESIQGQPVTAVQKAIQIICKGLHLIGRKRYQTIDEMRRDMKELLLRLEGKGISDSAIWEASVKNYKKQKNMDGIYLERQVQDKDGTLFTEEVCLKELSNGNAFLLKGPGGMGKTQFLMRMWSMGTQHFRKDIPIVVYIPLGDYQQTGAESYYIRKSMLKNLSFSSEMETMEDALHELEHVLIRAGAEGRKYVLLLDGLNEAGSQRENLLKEIEGLNRYTEIGILVTDRTDSVKKYGLNGFESIDLLPLTENAVEQEMLRLHVPCPKEEKLKILLCNPMMLRLYCKISMMAYGGTEERANAGMDSVQKEWQSEKQIEKVEDLVAFYLERLELQEHRKFSGDEKEQLCISYLLNHLLPKIADELKQHKKTLFSLEELYEILKKDYQVLQGKYFGLAFSDYMGKTRLIFKDIKNDKEWFDYAISEQLVDRLNLIEKTAEGNYGLIHDNFMDCLAEMAKRNRQSLRVYQRKATVKKTVAGMTAAAVVLTGGILVWKNLRPQDPKKGWNEILEEPVNRMLINLGVWNGQMKSQMDILEYAGNEKVLGCDETEMEHLREWIERGRENAESSGWSLDVEKEVQHLENLDENELDHLGEIFEELYEAPYELLEVTEEVSSYLEAALCDTGVHDYEGEMYYYDKDSREKLISTYRTYLDGVTALNFWRYNLLLVEVDEQTASYMMENANELTAFRSFMQTGLRGSDEKDKIEAGIAAAEKNIRTALEQMGTAGYEESLIYQMMDWQR